MICHVVYSFAVIVAQVSVDSFFHQAQVFKNLPSFSTQFVLLEMCKGFKQNTQTYWNWESSCFTREWGHIQVDSGRIWRFFQLNIFIIKIVKVAAIYTWILSEFEDFSAQDCSELQFSTSIKSELIKVKGVQKCDQILLFQYSELHLSFSPF